MSPPPASPTPAPRPVLSKADVLSVVRVASGTFVPGRTTLFSVFRDEIYFAPAFFAHYRAIGVEQFLILDDGSIDGTREFLASQPDCVLLASDLFYGEPIVFVDHEGRRSGQRAGIFFKMAIPQAFLSGDYVIYVDADEFLFLPPGVANLAAIFARLRSLGAACCVASIVEFFPEKFSDLGRDLRPRTLADLLERYGDFEAEPVVAIDPFGAPKAVGRSKTTRLFAKHRIRMPRRGLRKKILGWFRPEYRKSPQFKTPIYLCSDEDFLVGTHVMNKPAAREILLTIGHFVFTSQFEAKVRRALAWRSYVNGSDKYEHYDRLLRKAAQGDDSFAGEATTRFTSVEQFEDAGLMRWPD